MHPAFTDEIPQAPRCEEGTGPKNSCCESVETDCGKGAGANSASTRRKSQSVVVSKPVTVIEWILRKFSTEESKANPLSIVSRVSGFLASQSTPSDLKVLVDLLKRGVLHFHRTPENLVLAVTYNAHDKVVEDFLKLLDRLCERFEPTLNKLAKDYPDAIHIFD
jgi:hypothetical protein